MNFSRNLIALVVTGVFATASMAMTPAEHTAAKSRISADYKLNKAQCDAMKGNAKDICKKEAEGKQKVAKAELEAQYKPSDKAHYNVRKAQADAQAQTESALSDANKQIADLAILATQQILGRELANRSEQERFVAEFLAQQGSAA